MLDTQYRAVVIDNGTGFTKMGYAGNLDPDFVFPTAIAELAKKGTLSVSTKNDEFNYYIGDEAIRVTSDSKNHTLIYPMKDGIIESWELMEKYWHQSIYNYMKCDPQEHYFVLTEPPMNPPENRENIAEIFFETFNVPGLYIGVQAVLALVGCRSTFDTDQATGISEDQKKAIQTLTKSVKKILSLMETESDNIESLCSNYLTAVIVDDNSLNKEDLLSSEEEKSVLDDVFKQLLSTYGNYKNTLASTLSGHINSLCKLAKINKFSSSMEASLFNEEIDVKVYNNLIDNISKNLDCLYKYFDLKKEILGVSELHLYDTYAKVVDDFKKKYSFEEAKKFFATERSSTSKQAIGYKELKPYLDNEITLNEAVEKLKTETRRYAKRQLTWFRKNKDINWLYIDRETKESLLEKSLSIIRNFSGE